jgi:predicted nucleic acid-binding protein
MTGISHDRPGYGRSTSGTAFLDANVIRGQLTNDILLTLAEKDLFQPRWSQEVLDEMRRNCPPGVSEERIDRRIDAMKTYFPEAMTRGHEGLTAEMQADAKDQHVLAAAVHSKSAVLVTDNVKDFHPPSTGPHKMPVERLSQFLNRKLDEHPDRVQAALQGMVAGNRRDPRTMPALIDKMAAQSELLAFAQKLNDVVPPEQRGSHEALTANQGTVRGARSTAASAALDGVAPASGAVASKPQAEQGSRRPGHNAPDKDRSPRAVNCEG